MLFIELFILVLLARAAFLWWSNKPLPSVFRKQPRTSKPDIELIEVAEEELSKVPRPGITVTMELVSPQHQFHPRAWLYFLSRMERGCNVTHSEGWGYWVPILGKPLHVALQELLHDGFIRMGTPREKIAETHTMADLKGIATTYNIKLPRKKGDAVTKLFDALPDEMQHRSDQLGYVYCTQSGKEVLMQYYREESALHLQAQTEVLGHLEDGNLTDAINATRRYWDTQVFRRGSFGGDDRFVMTFLGNVLGGNYSHNDKMATCILYLLSDDHPGKWAIEKANSLPQKPAPDWIGHERD